MCIFGVFRFAERIIFDLHCACVRDGPVQQLQQHKISKNSYEITGKKRRMFNGGKNDYY